MRPCSAIFWLSPLVNAYWVLKEKELEGKKKCVIFGVLNLRSVTPDF